MLKIIALAITLALFTTATANATLLTFDRAGTVGQFTSNYLNDGYAPDATYFNDYGDNVTWLGSPATVQVDRSAVRSQVVGTTIFQYGTAGGPTPNVAAHYPIHPSLDAASVVMGVYTEPSSPGPAGNDFPNSPDMYCSTATLDLTRYITLKAAAGYLVRLDSFNVDSYLPADRTLAYAQVLGFDELGNPLPSPLWSMGNVNGTSPISIPHATGTHFNFGGTPLFASSIAIEIKPLSNNLQYYGMDSIQFGQVVVPEPASLALLGLGATAFVRRRAR